MGPRVALGILAVIAFVQPAVAQPQAWYWCDASRSYYPPHVPTCPVPWRAVSPPAAAPTAPPQSSELSPGFPGPGEPLYDWCANEAKRPASIAICSDRELRALTIERQKAFDEARKGLEPERNKALLTDQQPGSCRTRRLAAYR